ncbi:MAG: hypothetical protein JRH06_06590 [Deltaproteobacteria bacterium]|nr:hypothetical protein [Deltaproteobacteria bacterium]
MGTVNKTGFKDVKAAKEENGESITEISGGIKKLYELGKVLPLYKKFLEKAREQAYKIKSGHGLNPSEILPYIRYSIELDLINDLYNYSILVHGGRDDLVTQTVAVTFASMKVGKGLQYDDKRVLDLGLAAFFENVGMYKLPQDILDKENSLNKWEKDLIRQHPVFGHELLSGVEAQYDWHADIALQAHERYDGLGYPFGLAGEEIREEALIIGLMDRYVAMCSDRPYRKRSMPPEVVKYILGDGKKSMEPGRLKAFLEQISLFPVNTMVKLNNQCTGRVISANEKNPFRPAVEILYDSSGNKVKEAEIINLIETPLYYISQTVDETVLLDKGAQNRGRK